jgi:hypothetical protein
MVSLLSTSSVMVFPVSVFTKICISAGGLLARFVPLSLPYARGGVCVVGVAAAVEWSGELVMIRDGHVVSFL